LPKLAIFAAVEKVIIDQDNNLSLINLIQEIKVEIPEQMDEEIAKQEGIPLAAMRWSAFSMWHKTDADHPDTEYQQRVALIDPAGKPTGIEARVAFKFGEKIAIRNTSIVLGFPVHLAGQFVLRLWMNEKGQPESAEPLAEYPIKLSRGQPKA
jgi:hypothetical protein